MKIIFLIIGGVFFSWNVSAQVVSLTSGRCADKGAFTSTAYLFNYQGRSLVLGSAEYVLNSNSGEYCHRTQAGGQALTLRLVKHDWGMGLALLEPAAPIPSAPEIKWGAAGLMKKVMVGRGSALVIANGSDRHHFPLQKSVLEIGRVVLSRGDAGLPVFDYNNPDQVVGFISSQFVFLVAGEGSRIVRWIDTNLDPVEGPFIAFSAASVKTWLDDTLAQPNPPAFSLDVLGQLQKQQKINWAGLSFTENCPPPLSDGSDTGYPIGGGDPFGIGGTGRSAPPCKFSVSLSSSGAAIPAARAAWVQEMTDLLKQNKTVDVYLGYQRINNLLINTGLISIGSFFKNLANPDMQFVILVDEQGDPAQLSPLQKKSRQLRKLVRQYPFDSKDHSFRNRAYLTGLLLEGPDWNVVQLQDLDSLKKDSPWLDYDSLIDDIAQELRKLKP